MTGPLLVWAEGSLYAISFEDGLEPCRGLLAPSGALGLTEAEWLSMLRRRRWQ